MRSPTCPACSEVGNHYHEDQYRCDNPQCRVTTYENYGQT